MATLIAAHGGHSAEHKLTSNSSENSVSSAAISPDGKYLAYADSSGIYLKRFARLKPTPFPCRQTSPPVWTTGFPRISFTCLARGKPGKASLWSISIFGGSPRNWQMTLREDRCPRMDLALRSGA